MLPVLEAVPNFSEGKDLDRVRAVVEVITRSGVEVLDWSADPHHNRSVVTFIGEPQAVEAAAVAAAVFCARTLGSPRAPRCAPTGGGARRPPLCALAGPQSSPTRWRAPTGSGPKLSELGLPVYFYGLASSPPGRRLAEHPTRGASKLYVRTISGGPRA